MKNLTLLTFLLCTTLSYSFEIPNKLLGRYETTIPDFEFEDNGHTVQAAGYNLAVVLRENYLWYHCGSMQLYGTFTETAENEDNLDIKVNVSNDISISFDFDLSINKKTKSIAITGLKGLPELNMRKHQIQVTKKA